MLAAESPSGLASGRIGPNAILQTIDALVDRRSPEELTRVFVAAGIAGYLDSPPAAMVDERDVAQLHQRIRTRYPAAEWQAILSDAGRRTGEYVMANRIPAPVRWLMQSLPATPARAMLLSAIERHAWTFAGSGEFRAVNGEPALIEIERNPIVAGERADHPVCHWHTAVFETLFQRLVSRRTRVLETACSAAGGSACRFEIWC
ncbi:MAG TPA: bacteriochlorophyll 4-vinyl reductase [Steroidobacteraceae bacterium]|nr:bacteriochlorophyll 4-vinyl reductase [Steroidobacteraceae bacterium]